MSTPAQNYSRTVQFYSDANRNIVRRDTQDWQVQFDSPDPSDRGFGQITLSGNGSTTANLPMQPGPGGALRPGWFTNLFTYDLLDDKIGEDMDARNLNPTSLLTSYTYDPNNDIIKEIIGAPQLSHNMAVFARLGPPSLTLSALIGDDGCAAPETRILCERTTLGSATGRRSDLLMNSPNGRMKIARREAAARRRVTRVKLIEKVPAGRLNFYRTPTAHECGTKPRHERMGPRHASHDAAMGDAIVVYDAQNRRVRTVINDVLTGNTRQPTKGGWGAQPKPPAAPTAVPREVIP